jgi:hypothetical protein
MEAEFSAFAKKIYIYIHNICTYIYTFIRLYIYINIYISEAKVTEIRRRNSLPLLKSLTIDNTVNTTTNRCVIYSYRYTRWLLDVCIYTHVYRHISHMFIQIHTYAYVFYTYNIDYTVNTTTNRCVIHSYRYTRWLLDVCIYTHVYRHIYHMFIQIYTYAYVFYTCIYTHVYRHIYHMFIQIHSYAYVFYTYNIDYTVNTTTNNRWVINHASHFKIVDLDLCLRSTYRKQILRSTALILILFNWKSSLSSINISVYISIYVYIFIIKQQKHHQSQSKES